MFELFVTLTALVGGCAVLWVVWTEARRQQALRRLQQSTAPPPLPGTEEQVIDSSAPVRRINRRYTWAAYVVGAFLYLLLRLSTDLPAAFVLAFAIVATVASTLIESQLAARRYAKLEQQLIDLIDLIVGSLRAGAGVLDSFDNALRETQMPLRPLIESIVARIRLGDRPQQAMRDLSLVPLETFQLFSFTMSVHWEVGGSLAPALATVARSIRDRIEVGSRIRGQSAQAKASVFGIMGISYGIVLLVSQSRPEQVAGFLSSDVGSTLAAAAIILQAIGMIWITRMSQIKF
ncbi:MAG: type II secretion system F family protein [Planctomycetota bacterium]